MEWKWASTECLLSVALSNPVGANRAPTYRNQNIGIPSDETFPSISLSSPATALTLLSSAIFGGVKDTQPGTEDHACKTRINSSSSGT